MLICSDTRNYSCTPLGREVCNSLGPKCSQGKYILGTGAAFFLSVPSLALLIYHNTFSYCLDPVSKPHLNTLAVTIDGVGMGNKDSYETAKACGQSISLLSVVQTEDTHGVPDMCIAMRSQSNRASVTTHTHSAMLAQACVCYV